MIHSKNFHKLEIITNIAIIVVAILLGVFLIQNIFFHQNTAQPLVGIAKGTKISLLGTSWGTNQKTLLLVLQKGCKFCTQSMPLYKTLVEKSREKGIKLVAVLPTSREESVQYLKENGLEIQEINQAPLNSINVKGTPTLILVNDKGEVLNSWIGKLSSEKEADLFESL